MNDGNDSRYPMNDTMTDDLTPGEQLYTDYARMSRRIRPEQLSHEMLVRAARLRHHQTGGEEKASQDDGLLTIDATAGLGEDSMLLAAAGYVVEMYEKNPVTSSMLRENIRQAAEYPGLAKVVSRLHIHAQDSVEAMRRWSGRAPDLVYLDPMFPARTKSAKVKKKLQVLQQLEDPEDAAGQEALLQAALSVKPQRIVIKRPAKGPYLAGQKPTYSIAGKVIRYDVIVVRNG